MDIEGLEQHRRILGILFIVMNVLTLLASVGLGLLFGVFGLIAADGGAGEMGALMVMIAVVFGSCLFITSVPGVITGIGLLRRRPWARIMTLILGILGLPNFPLGTALGAYAIWFYGQQGSQRVFE